MAAKIKFLLLLLVMLAAASCVMPDGGPQQQRDADLPSMLTLGASYCQYCRAMQPVISKLSAEYRGKINIMYVDAQRNPEYARRYPSEGVPFTVLLDKNGRVIFSQLGYMDERELRQILKRYLLQ